MKQTIGSCTLAKAQLEISAEEHELITGPYELTVSLPDTRLLVSPMSRAELEGLRELIERVLEGRGTRERWDGQSGG